MTNLDECGNAAAAAAVAVVLAGAWGRTVRRDIEVWRGNEFSASFASDR